MTGTEGADWDPHRRLDRAAYPWQFTVKDRFNRGRLVGFGTEVLESGETVAKSAGPDYWTADEATMGQIAFAQRGVYERVKDANARWRQAAAETKPES